MSNEDVVRRWFAAMERHDPGAAVALWAEGAVNHASGRHPTQVRRGPAAINMVLEAMQIAFPDRRWEIDDVIAEGDRVVCLTTVSGTFGAVPPPPPGPLPPDWVGLESTALVPASARGKPYSVKHIHVFRVANGQIAEHWAARDDLSLLLQLGAISPPAARS